MDIFPLILVLISTFMHAGWNLLARGRRGTDIFLPMTFLVSVVGLGPVMVAEFLRQPILPAVWPYLVAAGCFQALYYLGLMQGYKSGDFTVVYPIARSLPVLALAGVDVWQGHLPTLWGWVGLGLISVGCVLIPLEGWQSFQLSRYWNRVMVWIVVTAVGMIGYTWVDREATYWMPPGAETAVRYSLFEGAAAFLAYWAVLKLLRYPTWQANGRSTWGLIALAALFMFGAYTLVLWAYQLAEQVSYVVALRQFSIVLGVVAGAILFHEPAPRWRMSMSLLIVLGVVLISIWG